VKHNLSLVALIAAVACNETYPFEVTAPENPAGKVYNFAAFGGDNQRATAGEQLPLPVSVLVKDESGTAASNLPIEFIIVSGGGSVSSPVVMTDANGFASSSWTLGWAVGKQSLWIRHGSSASSSAFITAEATVNPLSDVVVIRDALSPSVTLLLRGPTAAAVAAPEGRRLSAPDSVAYLPRHDPLDPTAPLWITAISRGSPPAVAIPGWTARPDTVVLSFTKPFKISLTVWVFENFEQNSAIVRRDVNNTLAFWRANPWGLELGELRILDATAHAGNRVSCANQVIAPDPASITIYYSANPNIGSNQGFTCSSQVIIMRPLLGNGLPFLLAHEFGHAFGLAHVPEVSNFMNGSASGGGVTTGQIFSAHLSSFSAINSVYHFRPAADLSVCCISDRFDF
jgi:hypothetical protein